MCMMSRYCLVRSAMAITSPVSQRHAHNAAYSRSSSNGIGPSQEDLTSGTTTRPTVGSIYTERRARNARPRRCSHTPAWHGYCSLQNTPQRMKTMAEQRRVQSADRRRPSSPFSSLHGLRGRRRSFRRDADRVNPRVSLDWHAPQLLVLTIGIMLLCLADAHNTLQLIKAGAEEMNLVMEYLLSRGTLPFVWVKLGLTALSLVVLVAYQHVTVVGPFRVRHVLYSILLLYLALVSYELILWSGAEQLSLILI